MSDDERDIQLVNINSSYISNLEKKFPNISFNRINKSNGLYITNDMNKSLANDSAIFRETQIKRMLRYCTSQSDIVKRKLSYFSRNESESEIYQKDAPKAALEKNEKFVIHHIGHATELIQIEDVNILTDPVFGDLNRILYPAKTASHPKIEQLPPIDIILISHNHRDHVDKRSLQNIRKQQRKMYNMQPYILVPLADKKLIESFGFNHVEEVDWYTKICFKKLSCNLDVISFPSDHRSGRGAFDHHKSLVTGWIINPQNSSVLFKFSGDTRPLTVDDQKATDAVIWNEIQEKTGNKIVFPDIVCLEPSGPNYTRSDMDVTHQSTSYSILLKFIEAYNLSILSGISYEMCLDKVYTYMIHQNKYELGPDRFDEGKFIFKKLLNYLKLSKNELDSELIHQKEKLSDNLDKIEINKLQCLARTLSSKLPPTTSLFVHAKDFIITDIKNTEDVIRQVLKTDTNAFLQKYSKTRTFFPKIGERINDSQLKSYSFDSSTVHKYDGKSKE